MFFCMKKWCQRMTFLKRDSAVCVFACQIQSFQIVGLNCKQSVSEPADKQRGFIPKFSQTSLIVRYNNNLPSLGPLENISCLRPRNVAVVEATFVQWCTYHLQLQKELFQQENRGESFAFILINQRYEPSSENLMQG